MAGRDLTDDEIRARYNAQADVYQTRYVGVKGDYYRRFEDRIFLDYLDVDGKRVLDLGTGRGRLALLIAERAKEVIGIDLSDEMIRHATTAAAGHSNVHFEVGNAARLRFADGSFDCVSSVGMFPYVRDVLPYFTEINRVLVDGGAFAFSIANAGEWRFSADAYGFARGLLARLRGEPRNHTPAESPLIPHDIGELQGDLERAGFDLKAYRSTFFFVPSRLFYFGGRRNLRPLQSLATSVNAALGQLPWTRDHGKVAVLCARKVRRT